MREGCNHAGCEEDHCCNVVHQADAQNMDPSSVCDNCPGFEAAGGICKAAEEILHVLENHTPVNDKKARECYTAAIVG